MQQEMGAGPHVRGVIGQLRAMGHEVIPVFGGDLTATLPVGQGRASIRLPPPLPGSIKAWLPAGIKHDVRIFLFNRFVNRETERILDATRPDVIYERDAYLNGRGPLLAHSRGLPHVLESDVTLVDLARLEFRSWLAPLAERIEARKHRETDLVVVSSETARQAVLQRRSLPADRVFVKNLGVDVARFSSGELRGASVRQAYGLEESVVVGYAGSFLRHHGVDLLLEAARLLRSGSRRRIDFLLIGGGSLKEEYELRARELGLTEVKFPGLIPHEEIPAYLAAMDICVVPHAHKHVLYPIKLLEYGALRKAVVVPDLPQFREVVQHGESGFLFRSGSADSLADAIRALAEDRGLRHRLGNALRARVAADFSWERVGERLVSALEQVLGH